MLVQILANTLTWGLRVVLRAPCVRPHVNQNTHLTRHSALLLPAGMIALSLAGIESSFGLRLVPLASYAIALSIAALVGYALFRDKGVEYDASTAKFFVPGSWVPLGVIMVIFFAKYAHGVLQGLKADFITAPIFIVSLAAIYGLLSGYFTARAFNLIKKAQMV